jgi:cytochrome c551/c552
MKIVSQVLLLMLSTMTVAAADEVIGDSTAATLLAKYGCQTCHSMDSSTLPGPSYRQIAKKYASDPQAVSDLESSILNGSSGAWGNNTMPPNDVPDKDLKALVVWILQLMWM